MPERGVRTIKPEVARKLAVSRQWLSGPARPNGPDGLMNVVRDLGCLQLDPIGVVARSHLLVLWSRIGRYDPADLDALLWRERRLFEYWAHSASIVLTEDFPIHRVRMRTYGTGDTPWERWVRTWMEENAALGRHVLERLRRDGPLMSRDFEDRSAAGWRSSGWTGGRNVSRMLDFLWVRVRVLIAGRRGLQRVYDLGERVLPPWTPRESLSVPRMVHRAAQRSLRALGLGTPLHITHHFVRGNYPALPEVMVQLERERLVERVRIVEEDGAAWRGSWFVHADDLPLLERLATGDAWQPRMTLLSPFDNLICYRSRTEKLFDFVHRSEFYVPRDKRKHGFYTMPILHGDRLIGRADPAMHRERGRLVINAVFAEPDAPTDRATARAVSEAIEDLAAFLGATEIEFSRRIPASWKGALH